MLPNSPRFITVTQLGGLRISVNTSHIESYYGMTAPGTGTVMQVGTRPLNLSETVKEIEALLQESARGDRG